jgi:hypothetical protein
MKGYSGYLEEESYEQQGDAGPVYQSGIGDLTNVGQVGGSGGPVEQGDAVEAEILEARAITFGRM